MGIRVPRVFLCAERWAADASSRWAGCGIHAQRCHRETTQKFATRVCLEYNAAQASGRIKNSIQVQLGLPREVRGALVEGWINYFLEAL